MVDELANPIADYVARHRAGASPTPAIAASPADGSSSASLSRRFELLRSVGEECQTEEELRQLLQRKPNFNLYDGFEPSGRMHIAQGVFKAINVNKCTQAGGTFIFWVADWFALMNDKMGGDLEKIKTVGRYLIEVWKAGGMDMTQVKFLWCSEQITQHAEQYWKQVLDVARKSNLNRIKRCCTIMGRKDDSLTAAQIMYPIMQCTDIFFLKADICQLGVDQRKVNMLARDYCDASKRKEKPIILSHHMLYGLKAGQAKMSKSDPDSAVFMEDTREDVERKIRNAYCPSSQEAAAKNADDDDMHLVKDELKNPCLDYVKNILFSREGFVFKAGNTTYSTCEDVRDAFVSGALSEAELKDTLIKEINILLDPIRQHFENDAYARDLLAKVRQYKKETTKPPESVTRLRFWQDDSPPAFVVFAPLPTNLVKLEAVWDVWRRLLSAPAGHQLVLWFEDWSAIALGKAGGSDECIRGFYQLLLHGLQSLAPALMERVRVCWQGEAILSGPSDYWISVINAGRRCSVKQIEEALPNGESLEDSSQVMAVLMHVADVLALCSSQGTIFSCDSQRESVTRFATAELSAIGAASPDIQVLLEPLKLRLLAEGEGIDADVNLLVTDKDLDTNRKIKKAFCEPGNAQFCPPLSWASALIERNGQFVVNRKPDNGGDKAYTDAKSLSDDFASGALHPGDLKPSLQKAINGLLEPARAGLKDLDVLKKAQKALDGGKKK